MYNNDELYHHGILGQRWGVRRYQNSDGSLTPAGRKRAAKLEDKYKKVTGKEMTTKVKESEKPKTVREMSDDELRVKTARMMLEKNYIETAKNLDALNPKQISRGKKVVNALSKTLSSAATEAGKQITKAYLIKMANDALGINAGGDDKQSKSSQQRNAENTQQQSSAKKQASNEYAKAYEDVKNAFREAAKEAAKSANTGRKNNDYDFYDATVNDYYNKPLLGPKKKRKR